MNPSVRTQSGSQKVLRRSVPGFPCTGCTETLSNSSALNHRVWGVPSGTLEGSSRKSSESASGVFPEFFWNFLQKVPAVLGVWPKEVEILGGFKRRQGRSDFPQDLWEGNLQEWELDPFPPSEKGNEQLAPLWAANTPKWEQLLLFQAPFARAWGGRVAPTSDDFPSDQGWDKWIATKDTSFPLEAELYGTSLWSDQVLLSKNFRSRPGSRQKFLVRNSQRVKTQGAKTSENFAKEKNVCRWYFKQFLRR